MTDSARRLIPAEFAPSRSHSGFANHLGPYYAARVEHSDGSHTYKLGLQIDHRHAGRDKGSFGHGGMLLALLDEAMGREASQRLGKVCVTVSLQTNFCAPFYKDDFIVADAKITRRGKNLVFVDGKVSCNQELVATATGVWMNSGKDLP